MSGAQLSNYATFLIHPEKAALSIVLTALSTAAGVVVTPLLVLLLLGQHIPVDVRGMAVSIMQIVILPVGIGTPQCLQNVTDALTNGNASVKHIPVDVQGMAVSIMPSSSFLAV